MRWSAGAYTRAQLRALAAISCLLGAACVSNSNKDVSGAYELSFMDGALRSLLYLFRSPDDEYLAIRNHLQCTVVRKADELILNHCGGANYGSFTLERDASGDLTQLSAFDQTNNVAVDGKIERSRHAPVLRALTSQVSPPSKLRPRLPWDAFTVDFGPGVLMDEATFAAAIEVDSSGNDDVEARWSYRAIEVPDSSRRVATWASATINWPDLLGQSVIFSLPAATTDSAGKTMSIDMAVELQLPQLSAPVRAWELDDEAELAGLVKWGRSMTLVRDTSQCEGSCLHTGKVISPCEEPGLAGQLDAHEASKLVVRVRTVTAQPLSAPLELGIYLGEPAIPDGARSSAREVLAERGEQRDTGFRDIELTLSAAQRRPRLPFELRLSYNCFSGPPDRNPLTVETTVLIDRVAAE